ncbi:MAG: alpha/beta fold hydrolase [Acidobacteriota bacterium]
MPTIERQTQNGPLEIYYEAHGERGAPVVILGHSFLCSGEMWREQVPVLARRYRVLNVDFRGHGRSGQVTAPFRIVDLADDLAAVLDAEDVDTAVWGGLSIGGMTAMRAALRHASRVNALLILDSHAGVDPAWKRIKYRALALGGRLIGLRPFVPAITPLMFGVTTRRERPELVREWEARFAGLHMPSIWHGVGALNRRRSRTEQLPGIQVPALVLVGTEDLALPPRYSEELARALPRAELVTVPQAGHLAALEQPEVVTTALEDFLERHAA